MFLDKHILINFEAVLQKTEAYSSLRLKNAMLIKKTCIRTPKSKKLGIYIDKMNLMLRYILSLKQKEHTSLYSNLL